MLFDMIYEVEGAAGVVRFLSFALSIDEFSYKADQYFLDIINLTVGQSIDINGFNITVKPHSNIFVLNDYK